MEWETGPPLSSSGSTGSAHLIRATEFFQGSAPTVALIVNNCIDLNLLKNVCNNATYILCADGGANRLHDGLQGEVIPDAVVGDLDSLRSDVRSYLIEKGAKIVSVMNQDKHDFDKSLEYLYKNGVNTLASDQKKEDATQDTGKTQDLRVVVLGGLGGRFDQDMANINSLFKWSQYFTSLTILSRENKIQLVGAGTTELMPDLNFEGPTCGIIPVGGGAEQVSTTGLKWNLKGDEIKFGGLISTSNEITGKSVTIKTTHPVLWTTSFAAERL